MAERIQEGGAEAVCAMASDDPAHELGAGAQLLGDEIDVPKRQLARKAVL